jgi:predicted RNA binding protein with dsRBD fold (UPF0201 family)
VYGRTGFVKTIRNDQIEIRRDGENEGRISRAVALSTPDDDPLHYLEAVIHGQSEEGSLSSLQTNVVVSEILDAARQSSQTGQTVKLPLQH